MGMISRALVPRGVRRATHPVRTVRRAATPKSVKRARRSMHPVSNAGYSVTRRMNTRRPRRRRPSQMSNADMLIQMLVWLTLAVYWTCWALFYWPPRTAVRAYRKRKTGAAI